MTSASARLDAEAFTGLGGAARTAATQSGMGVVRSYLKRAFRRYATGRVAYALSQMTDEQLAAVGIRRSQIPQYASEIMSGE